MNLEQDVKKSFPFWTGASSEIIDKWHTNIGFAWILDILGELVPIFSPSLSDSGEVFRVYPGFSARCVGSNPGAMGGGDPFDPFKQHGNCGNNKGNLMGISWYKQQSFGNIHGNIQVFLFRCPKYGLMNDLAGLTNASRICACSCPIGFLADDDLTTSDGWVWWKAFQVWGLL